MTMAPITGLPGPQTARTATHRRVQNGPRSPLDILPGGVTVNGALSRDPLNTGDVDVLRAGLLLGKITATGLYATSIVGTLTVAHTSDSATSMTVSAATATEINRIATSGVFTITGPPTAAGTVAAEEITYSAVNTVTGVITITADTTDYIAGSFIGGVHATASDGSQNPVTLIGDGFGHKVTDADGASVSIQLDNVLVAGHIDSSQVLNWPSDTSLQSWILSKLNGGAAATPAFGPFVFDHRF